MDHFTDALKGSESVLKAELGVTVFPKPRGLGRPQMGPLIFKGSPWITECLGHDRELQKEGVCCGCLLHCEMEKTKR